MPRYYIHLENDGERLIDHEGHIYEDVPAMIAAALDAARSVMSQDILYGSLPLNFALQVEDAHGVTVHRLAFADAVTIISPDARLPMAQQRTRPLLKC